MNTAKAHRPKRTYIRLAVYLAAQPDTADQIVISLKEIEKILGARLPPHAAFPFWWNNEGVTVHSRAWLSSGWKVIRMDPRGRVVEFGRNH